MAGDLVMFGLGALMLFAGAVAQFGVAGAFMACGVIALIAGTLSLVDRRR